MLIGATPNAPETKGFWRLDQSVRFLAIIQCESGETITKDDVHEFLKGKVARFKYPSRIKLIESLPMTATGKIKKADLKKGYGS